MNVGIIGAGAMGQAITQHAIRVGHKVMISNTRSPETLSYIANALGCSKGTAAEVAEFGDIVIAAVPLRAYCSLPNEHLVGKIVLDPMNYFPHRDGDIAELKNGKLTTSELLAKHIPGASVIKAFNSITVEDLQRDSRPLNAPDRRAIPIAGNDNLAKLKVSNFINELGFDVVDAGVLEDSWRFERYRPIYCVALKKDTLERNLLATLRNSWVPDGYWSYNRQV